MKRIFLLSIFLLFMINLSGCASSEKQIKFNALHMQFAGFSNVNGSIKNSPKENIYLFKNEAEWSDFKNTYLKDLPLPIVNLNDKNIIFIKANWAQPLSGTAYKIESIKLLNKKLTVTIQKYGGEMNVIPTEPNISYSFLIIATVDKNSLPSQVTPVLVQK